jgi:hypothetical protein
MRKMRQTFYPAQILARVDEKTRTAVENLAYKNRQSMGEATRLLLREALEARGLMD